MAGVPEWRMASWPWVSAGSRLPALADPHKPFIPLERLLLIRKPQGKVGVYVGCSALRSEPQAKGHCTCALAHLQHLLHAKSDPHEVQICPRSWVWMWGPSVLENLLIESPASEQEGTVWVPEARGGAGRGGGRVYMQAGAANSMVVSEDQCLHASQGEFKMQVEPGQEESLGFLSQEVGCPGGDFSWGSQGLKTQGETRGRISWNSQGWAERS